MKKLICSGVLTTIIAFTSLQAWAGEKKLYFGESPLRMKLYFVEFDVAPYGPTTEEVIEQYPDHELWFYGRNPFVKNLQKQLQTNKGTAKIDTDTIRLNLVVINGSKTEKFLVDRNGTVFRSRDKKTFKLSRQERDTIREQIMTYKSVVDKRPTSNPWGEAED